MVDSIIYGNSKPRQPALSGSVPLVEFNGLQERRPWIRKQVIKRMEGPNRDSSQWLSEAALAKTANGFWVAWREQDANRIGLLPKGTPRTRGCIWLQDPCRKSFEQWCEYIEGGCYERELLRAEAMDEAAHTPEVIRPLARHSRSAEPASPRFILPIVEAALAAGISTSTLERLVRLGQFPKPRLLSDRRVGWLTREIEAWAECRPYSCLLPPPNTGASKSRRKSGLRPD
jgi:prophage regulatory protein